MSDVNIERGDTFIVDYDRLRGTHFACVGIDDSGFFAGDTGGKMWRFEYIPGHKYKVYLFRESWKYRGTINAEAIVRE